jgi:hypothetical protein
MLVSECAPHAHKEMVMFQNLFGSVSRFLQRLAPRRGATQRGTTPQGQAKLDTFAAKQASKPMKPMTPEGQAKLEANREAKQQVPPPFAKPVGYGKGYPQKY